MIKILINAYSYANLIAQTVKIRILALVVTIASISMEIMIVYHVELIHVRHVTLMCARNA